jgi:mannosyltransferase OCH1-like enzyme
MGEEATIPRIIHQVHPTGHLRPALAQNTKKIRDLNPGWRYELYDDSRMFEYVQAEYGEAMTAYLHRIDPRYGAARADLFRYLLMYRTGGLYLDIKSGITHSLDECIRANDTFLLSKWRNSPGEAHAGFGLHKDLRNVPGGEYQQWWLASAPGHPYMHAVIEAVLQNIDQYRPWRDGVGKSGVLRLTGPVAYTKAISAVLGQHAHRRVDSTIDLGLEYSVLAGNSHKAMFANHYAHQSAPIVRSNGLLFAAGSMYTFLRASVIKSRNVLRPSQSRPR